MKELLKKIKFTDINYFLQKLINMKDFKNFNKRKPGNINSIASLNKTIRLKLNEMIHQIS